MNDNIILKKGLWYWWGMQLVKVVDFPLNKTLVGVRTYNNKEMKMEKRYIHISNIKEQFIGTIPMGEE